MNEPACNCHSLYEDEDGERIHYQECAVIQHRLGYA
jgi:hypothetical protein